MINIKYTCNTTKKTIRSLFLCCVVVFKQLDESASEPDTQTNTSGKPSKPPTSTRVPANSAPATASSDVVKPRRGRQPKHLTNGGTSKKEAKQKKPSITEVQARA